MIQIPMTPAQFAAAKAAIDGSSEVLSHSASGSQLGSFSTSQVGFSYSYNGVDTMTLYVTAKHGLAKFASDDTIKARLLELLGKLQTT
jgi:hypothetical protein